MRKDWEESKKKLNSWEESKKKLNSWVVFEAGVKSVATTAPSGGAQSLKERAVCRSAS